MKIHRRASLARLIVTRNKSRAIFVSACLVVGVASCATTLVVRENAWIQEAMEHLQKMRHDRDAEDTKQKTPAVIPAMATYKDPSGLIGSVNANGPTVTADNAFFQDLGTNGRTCFSCHQPDSGWGISSDSIERSFKESDGKAPIFRPVDGAVCPTADTSTEAARRKAYRLLTEKGLIRIAIGIPKGAEFSVKPVNDPYGCNTDPATGLTSPTSGLVSVYRRPLPSANLGFINAIMWDGREPSLQSQTADATTGHAQATTALTTAQIDQIIAFENGLLAAQSQDKAAGNLSAASATGGPAGLNATLATTFPGINDPLGGNPKGTPFTSTIFTLYDSWSGLTGSRRNAARASVQRGQTVFNTKPIAITGVNGINDALGVKTLNGFCGTCHDTPNVGNHSVRLPINIGIANAGPFDKATGTGAVSALDIADLPSFTISCDLGPNKGTTYQVTDLGRAMISGKCADIGKMKGPILRGLASRAPYFHNGSAKTLDDVVGFYTQRFGTSFTAQENADLVAFLKTL